MVLPVAILLSSVASFTRWASPPESSVEGWPSFTYPRPTSHRVWSLLRILGRACEELHRLIHGHLQHIGNVLALVADLQGLPVVPPALAHLAGHEDVRQEVHLDLQHAVAGAGLAPAAPDVEAEPPRAVAPALGLLSGGEQVPDVVEEAGVGGGVGPGCPADGALVDVHHLVQILDSLDPVAPAGVDLHPVQLRAQAS